MSSLGNTKHPLSNGIISKCKTIWGEAVYEVQAEALDKGFRVAAIKVRKGDKYGQDLEETPVCKTLDEAFHQLDHMLTGRLDRMLKNQEVSTSQQVQETDTLHHDGDYGQELHDGSPRRSEKAARKQRAMHAAEMYRRRKEAEKMVGEEEEDDEEDDEQEG